MVLRLVPGRPLIGLLAALAAAALVALLLAVPIAIVSVYTLIAASVVVVLAGVDGVLTRRAWRAANPKLVRGLPAAFAIGVSKSVTLSFAVEGSRAFRCEIYDHADPSLTTDGLPAAVVLRGGAVTEVSYRVLPAARGVVAFAPADVRVRSIWGLGEMLERVGETDSRRVFPDFAQVARYAWLAGDRRLQEIGVKTYQQRGEGTDFKQLTEYRTGDPVRHIDWRATLRQAKPIVREFQDERDQCVMLLVDCGRRMRAHDAGAIGTTHFDQVLNAVMLLSYVALQRGDAVGAMTFGTPGGDTRSWAPKKGTHALSGLMAEFFGVQPTLSHSDYVLAAQQLLARQHRRALVVLITNFRDEDASELAHALRLLRSRHLVLVASLRERIVGELMAQPLINAESAIDVASAHLYEQARRDAFNRLADRDALMVDAEPQQLGIALVNRYHAMKKAGRI